MKLLIENWRKFLNEKKIVVKIKKSDDQEMDCPTATQDLDLNTKNRNATRKNHMYGPLNVNEPGDYWQKLSEKWDLYQMNLVV